MRPGSPSTFCQGKDPKRIFGENLRRFRKARGLSQEKLGEYAHLHRTYVGAVERGERNISLENITRLACALKITAGQLLQGTSQEDGNCSK
ncbi:MAG TPA: helix-turn-helix transcriptional regulator [Candidatus Binatia bacterium]|nr:helix-turn-helix transcriptional regulator [Candidatus Binatia bacterium]